MILIDTSVWVDHLHTSDPLVSDLLNRQLVISHAYVIGELMLGGLRKPSPALRMIDNLPEAPLARANDVRSFIEAASLAGTGVGYVDVHLLASARLTPGGKIWTRDRRLSAVAERLGLNGGPVLH